MTSSIRSEHWRNAAQDSPWFDLVSRRICRFMDESRHDSVDIDPRRFEAGICARNFSEDAQQAGALEEEQDELVDEQYGLEDE